MNIKQIVYLVDLAAVILIVTGASLLHPAAGLIAGGLMALLLSRQLDNT